MAEFKLRCETCSFEETTATLEEALNKESAHKERQSDEHRVTIERLRES